MFRRGILAERALDVSSLTWFFNKLEREKNGGFREHIREDEGRREEGQETFCLVCKIKY